MYTSEFIKPKRAKVAIHPATSALLLTLVTGSGMLLCMAYVRSLIKRDAWTHKFKLIICLGLSSMFFKVLRNSYRAQTVIESISLRPNGKSLDIACHFPFAYRLNNVPIKDLKFVRGDDLARKIRENEIFAEFRCLPVVYKGFEYNLFIDGSIYDKDVMNAVTEGKLIDTSDSVNPNTLQSLIVDI